MSNEKNIGREKDGQQTNREKEQKVEPRGHVKPGSPPTERRREREQDPPGTD